MMSPERTSRTRYFARRIPRIDFVRIAIRPTRKFNAATRKNETTAETRNIRSAAIEAGGCTGKRSAMTIPIGSEERRRSEEHTSELQSQSNLVCRLLLEKKKKKKKRNYNEKTQDQHT